MARSVDVGSPLFSGTLVPRELGPPAREKGGSQPGGNTVGYFHAGRTECLKNHRRKGVIPTARLEQRARLEISEDDFKILERALGSLDAQLAQGGVTRVRNEPDRARLHDLWGRLKTAMNAAFTVRIED